MSLTIGAAALTFISHLAEQPGDRHVDVRGTPVCSCESQAGFHVGQNVSENIQRERYRILMQLFPHKKA